MTRKLRRDTSAEQQIAGIPIATPRGAAVIYPKCPPGFFEGLQLDSGLGNFSHYSSIIQKLDVFDKIASTKDGTVSLAIREPNIVIGYAVGHYPEPDERWGKLDDLMYELGAIEVSRNYRKMKLADAIVERVLKQEFVEDKIAYMNGFSWHWDLDGSGLTMTQYRTMMKGFLAKYGFEEYYTNEPNIALREENIFMARIGSRVSPEDLHRFRNLRFGMVNRK